MKSRTREILGDGSHRDSSKRMDLKYLRIG